MLAPEVQWLEKLVDQEQWDKILQVTEQIVRRGGHTTVEYAHINYAVCRARAHRQELIHAIPAGELCRRLCQDTNQWDLLGRVLLVLGVAYGRSRSYSAALSALYDYFTYQSKYRAARHLLGHVWLNIGNVLYNSGGVAEARKAFQRAREEYQSLKNPEGHHTATQLLLECYLQVELRAVPALLAEMRAYAANYPSQQNSRAGYYLARARYAYRVGAYKWAGSLCVAGLAEPNKSTLTEFDLSLLLSSCLAAAGDHKNALGYALSARLKAIHANTFDLEFVAIEAMYDLMSKHGASLLQALDREYLEQGLDMIPFVGGFSLPERSNL